VSSLTLAARMRESLGTTIAVWFPESMDPDEMAAQIARTLDDSELFCRPCNIVLVVDGCPAAVQPTRRAAEEFRARCSEAPVVIEKGNNEGQGGAVCCGIEYLLARADVQYIGCRDGDGDHDIYDLPPMFRLLQSIEAHENTDNAFVVGCRGSLHRPMGFARGEFERILNRVKMTALNACLAAEGRAVDERYCALQGDEPDFQSGYKLYTRRTANIAASGLRRAHAAQPERKPLRWGVQFISSAELLLSGAITGAIHRLTYDDQPQSTFEGKHNYAEAYGRQIAWLYDRLGTPPAAGIAWIDAAIMRSQYGTVEGGWQELLALRRYVIEACFTGQSPLAPPRRGEML